uniref:Uncharacterized protein n=1 Tax=Peronospora matthiolae TaxID=2874970 RepID=A0AAV1VEX6_9STRA
MVRAATGKEEEERRLQQLAEQEEEEDDDIGQGEFQIADDAGAILYSYLGDDFVEIVMEEGTI